MDEVSHAARSASKESLDPNTDRVLVTCDTSHAEMCRYMMVANHSSENQSATAAALFASVICSDGVYGGDGGGGDTGEGD